MAPATRTGPAAASGPRVDDRSGIDRTLAYEVLVASAAGAPYVGYKRASFVQPDETPVAFSLRLAEKDLRLITAFGASSGMLMPQAAVNLEVIRSAEASVGADADLSMVASHLRQEGR